WTFGAPCCQGVARARARAGGSCCWCRGTTRRQSLLRVQLDDQRFVDVGGQVAAVRDRLEHAAELLLVDFDPRRGQVHGLRDGQRLLHAELLLRLLRQRDRVAGLDLVGRQVDRLAVDRDAAVRDQLAGRGTGHREAHPVDHVVQARLKELQQVLTRVALLGGRLLVEVAELAFQQAVDALDLLLLAQLGGVVGQLAATQRGAVLAGLLLQLALGVERAGRRLERKVGAFAARELAGGTDITCHVLVAPLDAALLRRTAPVVRDWRHVDDVGDLVAHVVQRTHGRLAARTRALDADFQRLHAVVQRFLARLLGGDLGCERGRLARAAETRATRGRPRQRVALAVGDRDDGVVERSVDVGDAVGDDALDLLLLLASCRLGHGLVPYFLMALRGPLRVRALVRVRWPRRGRPRRWRKPR